jgi:hypothetical protein
MLPPPDFYGSGKGDSLIDPLNYPEEILEYLKTEEELIQELIGQYERLVEIGCMEGRYLDWCVGRGIKYLGIDVVPRYIETGRRKLLDLGLFPPDYQMEISPAEEVDQVLEQKVINYPHEKSLLFFPFNSFGNMENPIAVLESLKRTRQSFLICSYQTTQQANGVRLVYYTNCGFKKIRCFVNEKGIRFASDEGLNPIAYFPDYFRTMCHKVGIQVSRQFTFSTIGMAYIVLSQ